jgi:hypothetical protein
MEKPFRHADQSKKLGYVVIRVDGTLATPIVFGTKDRAMNFQKSNLSGMFTSIQKVREETEREAHRWSA